MMTRYIVKHEVDGPQIHVYIYDTITCNQVFDINPRTWGYISEPDMIERIMKVTFETKIKNAVEKMQSVADELNKKNDVRKFKTSVAKLAYDKVFGNKHDA